MVEIGIGVLFALLFVAAYLLVSKLRGKERRWREIATQSLGQKKMAAAPPKLFLPAKEMREHHARSKGSEGR